MNKFAKDLFTLCSIILNGADYLDLTPIIGIEYTWSGLGYGYRIYLGQYGVYDVTSHVNYLGEETYEFEAHADSMRLSCTEVEAELASRSPEAAQELEAAYQ